MADRIGVRGLREFRAGLRQMDRGLPRQVRQVANRAAEIVVDAAQPRVPSGPASRGHALSSIRTASTQSAGRVKGGGARFPYFAWLEFGGRVGRNRSVYRPVRKAGRYIYPAFADRRPQVRDAMVGGLRDLARDAGVRIRAR